jgi:3-isopropylmalate dehydrogenase
MAVQGPLRVNQLFTCDDHNMKNILVLPGDGVGQEVTAAAESVLLLISRLARLDFKFTHALVGGACYDKTGEFITDETMALARGSEAILFGAEGGPKWDSLELTGPPERRSGLTRLRRELELFANLRPIRPFRSLLEHSSLKPEVIRDADFIIVRELCGGIYFGQPRGIDRKANGELRGYDTLEYTEGEIERIARVAFELARSRHRKVSSVDKSNVLESGILWRKTVARLGAENYPDVTLEHLFIDNAAMQVVRRPSQFDVIVTENLFGDILSDGAAMAAGSLGMLPSASLSARRSDSHRLGLYEPVHGSAPDIAGKDIANPLGAILSVGLMLTYSFERPDLTAAVEEAVASALESGVRPRDLGGNASTNETTAAVVSAIAAKLA